MKTTNFLKLTRKEQLNPAYNPRFANNGGGYNQPDYIFTGAFNGNPVEVSIHDTSCGDFGDRYYIKVTAGGKIWDYYFNSIEREVVEESSMTKEVVDFLDQNLPLYYEVREG